MHYIFINHLNEYIFKIGEDTGCFHRKFIEIETSSVKYVKNPVFLARIHS